MVETVVVWLHVMSLALWFGGLFAYVVIVWPVLLRDNSTGFPRETLVSIGVRTAPWIYAAMSGALTTFGIHWWLGGYRDWPGWSPWTYALLLLLLVGNNVYGSLAAWPRIMFATDDAARSCWDAFYSRAAMALLLGLAMLSVSVVAS